MSIVKINHFEFYYLPLISITTFFFYYFEVINNMSWIAVIIHIRESSSNTIDRSSNNRVHRHQYSLKKLWYREMILI